MQPTEVIWDNAAWRMTNVLVVDDEPNLVDLVKGYLEREGFEVSAASDGPTAVDLARALHPDVVVLDLMLPGFDGLEVCRRLRQFTDAYVLMLTARGEEVDRIVGLEVGADDYLTKPFSPRELVARVKAMLRRPRGAAAAAPDAAPVLRLGKLMIDEGDVFCYAFSLVSGNPCAALVALNSGAHAFAALASAAAFSLLWQLSNLSEDFLLSRALYNVSFPQFESELPSPVHWR